MNFGDYRYYLNRELSWLAFNDRVLEEAVDPNNPLLEKLKFLAITSSDEFFMIRVAGLKHQVENGIERRDIANMTPEEQINRISNDAHNLVAKQYQYLNQILEELEGEGLYFIDPENATESQKAWLEDYFQREIFPVVTPMAVCTEDPEPGAAP